MEKAKNFSRPARHESSLLWLPLGFLFMGVLLLIAWIKSPEIQFGEHALGGVFEMASAGLGMWLALIIIWWSKQRKKFDPFELPTWISLNAYGQVVLNVWLLQREKLPPLRFLWSQNYQALAAQAVLLIGVGLTALWAGYIWAFRLLEKRLSLTRPATCSLRLIPTIAIWITGWSVGILAVLLGVQGYEPQLRGWAYINYLHFASLITDATQMALMFLHFQHPTILGWLWIISVISINVITSLAVATRGAALIFVQLMIVVYYLKGRLSKQFGILALLAVLGFLLLVPLANAVREGLLASAGSQDGGFAARIAFAATALRSLSLSQAFYETYELFQGRQGSLLFTTSAVLLFHPRVMPYVGKDILAQVPEALIPRALWPSKPFVEIEAYNTTALYRDWGWGGGTAIGLFADSYRWGGWFATALILFFIGALSAWMYRQGPGSRDWAGTLFYITVGLGVITYDSSVFRIIMDLLQKGPLVWIIIKLILFNPANTKTWNSRKFKNL